MSGKNGAHLILQGYAHGEGSDRGGGATATVHASTPRFAIAAKGFRPFFLLASLFAALIVPLWLLVIAGSYARIPTSIPSRGTPTRWSSASSSP